MCRDELSTKLMEKGMQLDEFLRRRADFILREARCGAKRDQVVTFAMRVLSNFASIRRDGQSGDIKRHNKRVSKAAALELHSASSFRDWSRSTINEHEMPLKETWDWICSDCRALRAEHLWSHFLEWPMCTVMRDEDQKLNSRDFRRLPGKNRYQKAKISTISLPYSPKEYFANRRRDFPAS